jgi:hypothetical protein
MVYFCAFARSEIFQKNARELGVGRGQFHSGVNGLKANTTILGFRVIQWFSKGTTLFVSIDDRWAFFILTLQPIFKGLKCGSFTG